MDFTKRPWWAYLEEGQQDGLTSAYALLDREKKSPTIGIHDFSFIVFPAAKAYEGFLKKLFFDLGFITEHDYKGDRFRIGRALNPNLERNLRYESVYDKLATFCQGRQPRGSSRRVGDSSELETSPAGKTLPDMLWQTWKSCRNLLFHWWPEHKNFILLEEAEDRVDRIVETINKAFSECKLKRA